MNEHPSPPRPAQPGDEPTDRAGTIEQYRAALPAGSLTLFRITAIDRLGVPTWSVTLHGDEGSVGGGLGYGETDDEAKVGAFGELSEMVHGAAAMRRIDRRRSSYRRLVRDVGPMAATDPLTLGVPAGSDIDSDTDLEWVPARRWTTGETVWVPTDIAASDHGDLAGYSPFTTPITNGRGAGHSLSRAMGHALLELAQRDGNGLSFRALDRGVVIDTTGAGPATAALLARLDAAEVDVVAKLASTDLGLANVYVVGRDRSPDGDALMATACGEAADPDRDRALRKAILEFAAARARKAFCHGPLDRVDAVAPPGYLETYLRDHRDDREEPRALDAMVAWLDLDVAAMSQLLADSVLSERATVALTDLPTAALTTAERTDAVAAALGTSGLDVLWLDLSPADAERTGVRVVKAVVPGMEVETMSYHRIGERGAARLLACDSPLAGRGRPTRPGAQAVRLTPEAQERLGGPVWLDVELVERTVGALYPLYREPGRHRAPLAAGARP